MDWLGIGVTIIGVALLVLSIILIKPLGKVADLLDSVKKTTDELPITVQTVTEQTSEVMNTVNNTITNVNGQVSRLTPTMQLVEDIGIASRQVTAKTLLKSEELQQYAIETRAVAERQKFQGIFSLASFALIMAKNKEQLISSVPKFSK